MARKRRKRPDLRIHLMDEAPRLGCGWRGVNVIKIGRKWVKIQETATGINARLSKSVWHSITQNI